MHIPRGKGILLTINSKGLDSYEDPNFEDGVYTYQNIHPNNIIKIEPIDEN